MIASREFTDNERKNRDAWTTSRMENDCEGCSSRYDAEGYEAWTPGERCPVHGLHAETWWKKLNDELDRRWPGTWS
jgi:hypothetical protein